MTARVGPSAYRSFSTQKKAGSLAVSLSDTKKDGHYLYVVQYGQSIHARRFYEYRALKEDLLKVVPASSDLVNKFPPHHLKNKLGLKLSAAEAARRASELENWLVEIYSRNIEEGWPSGAGTIIGSFLGGDRLFERRRSSAADLFGS